jgi:GNAT superfamily N-acetyltransferase
MLVTMTEARLACLSTTWSPQQRLHPGNLAWAHARGDGSPAPTGTLSWGDPLAGFADVWVDASGEGPAEVSMHVTPRASPEAASRFLAELLEAWPELHVEVSTEDRVLLPALQAAGFRVDPGPWFVQLWRRVDDLADLTRHQPAPAYRIETVDPEQAAQVAARVDVHRRAWAPARIKGLIGLEVTGAEPASSYSLDKHRAVMHTQTYRPELDVVAVDRDGDVAAYALGWYDERSRSLLFEPVGTDPAHAGRGLARALCAHLLRSAGRLGATDAVVGPRGDAGYPLPRRVYEGLGMGEVARFVTMTNEVSTGSTGR